MPQEEQQEELEQQQEELEQEEQQDEMEQEEQQDEMEQEEQQDQLERKEQPDEAESNGDGFPLLFIYDCETTGLGIYTEHITEIAAKITGVPLSSISQPTYTSLVKTSRTISKNGMHNT